VVCCRSSVSVVLCQCVWRSETVDNFASLLDNVLARCHGPSQPMCAHGHSLRLELGGQGRRRLCRWSVRPGVVASMASSSCQAPVHSHAALARHWRARRTTLRVFSCQASTSAASAQGFTDQARLQDERQCSGWALGPGRSTKPGPSPKRVA
jgi:hypothetical protein